MIEKTPLPEVIQQMERSGNDRITVLSPAGAVAGVIDRGDITRAVGEKLGFGISSTLLQQIKTSGDYPPGLQLGRIADSVLEFQGKNAIGVTAEEVKEESA